MVCVILRYKITITVYVLIIRTFCLTQDLSQKFHMTLYSDILCDCPNPFKEIYTMLSVCLGGKSHVNYYVPKQEFQWQYCSSMYVCVCM